MAIKKEKIRKEVHLTKDVIKLLQKKANTEGRSLKNFMERTLISVSGRAK